jgi:hypothetical protein
MVTIRSRAIQVGANETSNFLDGRTGLWNERRQELPRVRQIFVEP